MPVYFNSLNLKKKIPIKSASGKISFMYTSDPNNSGSDSEFNWRGNL